MKNENVLYHFFVGGYIHREVIKAFIIETVGVNLIDLISS